MQAIDETREHCRFVGKVKTRKEGKTMRKKMMVFVAMCLMGTLAFPQYHRSVARTSAVDSLPPPNHGRILFDKVKTRHVIIRGSLGSGTGSFIKMNDGVWLVTNEHVTRIGHPLVAITVEGRRIKFSENSKFQVAKNRDIARLKMPDDTYALNLSSKVPILGTRVWVFGNSAGGNVLTCLEGSINGVGAYEVEVDAQFVGGGIAVARFLMTMET